MDHWVVIPCHNNSALLIDGLESILAQTISVRIFAIDNGSKDNTPFVLNTLGNEHVVARFDPQLGVAGAWNLGLRKLFNEAGAERVLVTNQDVILRPDTYETLLKEDADFVTAVSTREPNLLEGPSGGRRPHPDFSCYCISKICYNRVGPFDESYYPAYFEDNDYHIRMAKAGIEAYCLDFPFYHYGAGTMKNATEEELAQYYGPGFLHSKQYFQSKWGVLPGTKQYEEMCSPRYWQTTN
jgi:GT2 family glycosyltransferase